MPNLIWLCCLNKPLVCILGRKSVNDKLRDTSANIVLTTLSLDNTNVSLSALVFVQQGYCNDNI